MSVLLDLAVPGLGSVVDVLLLIVQIGKEMVEVQHACARLHHRLELTFNELLSMEWKGQLPQSDMLHSYVGILARSLGCLEHYRS